MINYNFIFNLETGELSKEDPCPDYSIKYYKSKNGKMVEIGDGYRHEIIIKGKYWNRILKIIKEDELDKSGIEAIVRGLLETVLSLEYEKNFICGIKSGVIKNC